MKKKSLAWVAPVILLALSSLVALPACDVIDNPQPAIVTSTLTPAEQTRLDSVEGKQTAPAVTQNVLIEDFTGQQCGNCPRAAGVAKSMQDMYPGRVFVTEVHVTDYFAKPKPPHFPLELRVLPTVSIDFEQAFDLNNRGLPQGAINRVRFDANDPVPVGTDALWPSMVTAELAKTPQISLRPTVLYNAATRTLRMKLNTKYLTSNLTGDLSYSVILVEDSVIGAQKDYRLDRTLYPEQTVEEYDHHNVMRAALAGTFGTPQTSDPTANKQFNTYFGYTFPSDATWQPRHCSIIAYITNTSSRQILQVAKVPLQ